MNDRIVIITGGRDLRDPAPVWAFLDEQLAMANSLGQRLLVFEGGCKTGSDLHARSWVASIIRMRNYVGHRSFPPDPKLPSPARYHVRNREMVKRAQEQVVLEGVAAVAGAFPGAGNGTRTVIKLLAKAGIETVVVELGKMPPEPEDELRLRALAKRDGFRGL